MATRQFEIRLRATKLAHYRRRKLRLEFTATCILSMMNSFICTVESPALVVGVRNARRGQSEGCFPLPRIANIFLGDGDHAPKRAWR